MSEELSKYVDVDGALNRLRGNKKLYAKMLNMFLNVNEFTEFEDAIEKADLNRAADLAHSIKGMTGNLSLTTLFEQSEKLMHQLRKGELDQELLAQYRETYTLTKGFVEEVKTQMENAV